MSAPGGYAATTNADGRYDLYLPPGSYTSPPRPSVPDGHPPGVTVTAGQATTAEPHPGRRAGGDRVRNRDRRVRARLAAVYAKITISGDPDAGVHHPYTGAYSVQLPQQASYQLTVTPVISRRTTPRTVTVQVGTASVRQDIKVYAQVRASPIARDTRIY